MSSLRINLRISVPLNRMFKRVEEKRNLMVIRKTTLRSKNNRVKKKICKCNSRLIKLRWCNKCTDLPWGSLGTQWTPINLASILEWLLIIKVISCPNQGCSHMRHQDQAWCHPLHHLITCLSLGCSLHLASPLRPGCSSRWLQEFPSTNSSNNGEEIPLVHPQPHPICSLINKGSLSKDLITRLLHRNSRSKNLPQSLRLLSHNNRRYNHLEAKVKEWSQMESVLHSKCHRRHNSSK